MTTPPPPRPRRVEDVDRDLADHRRNRSRCRIQINDYLKTLAATRQNYARHTTRIDELLDERTRLSQPAPPDSGTHPSPTH